MGEGLVMSDKILPFKPAMPGEQVEAFEAKKADEQPGEKPDFKLAYATEEVQHDKLGETKQWIAKGLLAKGECSRWIAPPKMMKSALLSSAMNHLGAGVHWQGFKVKRKIGGIYFALERPALTLRRLVAEQKDRKWNNLPIRICKVRFALAARPDVQAMIDTINRTSDEMKQLVEFITIDTSAKLIAAHGGDEQQAKDNALVWGNLAEVRLKTGVHSAVIGHMGKDTSKGERGSNSTLGDADVVISISGDDLVKTATVTDANDLAEGDLFSFTGKKYVFGTDEDGDEDAVHIVDSVAAAKPAHKDEKLTPNQKTFFTILHDAGKSGMALEDWNKQARDAGMGTSRKADLFDLRTVLLSKKLVREYNGRFYVNHK
jgi:hypothetical protein